MTIFLFYGPYIGGIFGAVYSQETIEIRGPPFLWNYRTYIKNSRFKEFLWNFYEDFGRYADTLVWTVWNELVRPMHRLQNISIHYHQLWEFLHNVQ